MTEIIRSLIKNTKIKPRLFFTLILLSIPLFCLLFLTLTTQNRAIQFGEKEIIGVAYNRILLDLMKDYRNTSTLLQTSKEESGLKEMDSILSNLNYTRNRLLELNSRHELELDTKDNFSLLLSEEDIFSKDVSSKKILESKVSILKILELLTKLNSHVGDTSNLILDPDLDSYYLMDITLIKIPMVIKVSTEIEQVIFSAISKRNLTQENQIKLFTLYSQLNAAIDQTLSSFEIAYKYNSKLKQELETKKTETLVAINNYKEELKFISNPANKETDMVRLENFPSLIKNYNESLHNLYSITSESQNTLLDIRVSALKMEQLISISLVLLVTGLTVFIQYLIVFSITNPLSDAVTKFELLAKGNLQHRIEYDGKDEIGALSNSINTFIQYLTNLLQIIARLTSESNVVFTEISTMTTQLSLSTESQAASTEESAAALEEISSSFNKISQSIEKEASDISEIGNITDNVAISTQKAQESIHSLGIVVEGSAKEVKKGEAIISKTVDSMNHIKSAADEIGKIILLITEISKQIGLLALNASIEAARAGEHGRGFSVVADEISKLSLKTEESVKHIRALIGGTNSSIKEGIHNVGTVVEVLRVVIEKINETNRKAKLVDEEISSQSVNLSFISNSHSKLQTLSEQIDNSAKEEKIAISQISQSMNRISTETQLISENLSQLKEASLKVSKLSQELTMTITKFEL
jgi:methyl-accepting chemotaxis protein